MLARVVLYTKEYLLFLQENHKYVCLDKSRLIAPEMDDSLLNAHFFESSPFSWKSSIRTTFEKKDYFHIAHEFDFFDHLLFSGLLRLTLQSPVRIPEVQFLWSLGTCTWISVLTTRKSQVVSASFTPKLSSFSGEIIPHPKINFVLGYGYMYCKADPYSLRQRRMQSRLLGFTMRYIKIEPYSWWRAEWSRSASST